MKIDNSPARGMRDLLPADVAVRDHVLESISAVYRRFGYQRIETPALEHIDRLSSGEGGDNEKLIFEVLRRGLPPEVPAGHAAARARRPGAALRPDRAADPVLREQPRVAADAVPVAAGGTGVAGGPAAARPVPAVLPVRHRHDRRAFGAGRGGADRGDDRGAGRDRADRDDGAAVGPAVPGRAGIGVRGARGGAGRLLHHPGQAGQDRLGRGASRAARVRVRARRRSRRRRRRSRG